MLGLALGMYISYFLCRFHLRLVPNANPISSGIWALHFKFYVSATWLGVRSYGMLPRKGSVAVGAPLYIVPSQQLLGNQVTNEKWVGPSLPSVGWKTPHGEKKGEKKKEYRTKCPEGKKKSLPKKEKKKKKKKHFKFYGDKFFILDFRNF